MSHRVDAEGWVERDFEEIFGRNKEFLELLIRTEAGNRSREESREM
jgi:hypothetical protein